MDANKARQLSEIGKLKSEAAEIKRKEERMKAVLAQIETEAEKGFKYISIQKTYDLNLESIIALGFKIEEHSYFVTISW